MNTCECGCGSTVVNGKRFVHGHNGVKPKAPAPNPSGFCQCGCGEKTLIAKHSDASHGLVRGEHMRYLKGHTRKGACSKGGVYLRPGHACGKKPRWIIHCRDRSRVYMSRAVMEAHIGRHLVPGEVVHHINHDTTDDRIENLMLFSSHGEHMRYEHIHDRKAA